MGLTMSRSREDTWREDLAAGTAGVQLAEVDHPLELYLGASDLGMARLQVRTAEKPNLPHLSDVVVVDRAQISDAWVLTLTLQDRRFEEVFIRLAIHVVDRTRSASSEHQALQVMDLILDQWKRLMTPAPLRRLGLDTLRGLVGELWFLIHRCADGRPFDQALEGWSGPLGAPQDFWFRESGFHELKSIGAGSRTVKITSAEQLDEDQLELVVLLLPQVPEGSGNAVNLLDLVGRAKGLLDLVDAPADDLEMRIKRMGVDLTDPYYAETWFEVRSLSTYDVPPDFPAIRASQLPLGVERVRYQVHLPAIEQFKATFENLA